VYRYRRNQVDWLKKHGFLADAPILQLR
jgi:hypothetical protein